MEMGIPRHITFIVYAKRYENLLHNQVISTLQRHLFENRIILMLDAAFSHIIKPVMHFF